MIYKWKNTKGEIFNVEYDEEDEKIIIGNVSVRVSKSGYKAVLLHKICPINNTRILSRILMKVSDPKIFVDHIDRNPLNNKKENLRLATPKQNSENIMRTEKAKNGRNNPENIQHYPTVVEIPNEKLFRTTTRNGNGNKSFNNNYDAIIYAYENQTLKGEFNPEKRTLIEIAEQIEYKYYPERIIMDKEIGTLCPTCNKMIKSSYNEHVKICTNLTCLNCDQTFSTLSHLYRHQEENCGPKICARCNETFKNESLLSDHVALKSCEYTCDRCNYKSRESSNMCRHKRDYHRLRRSEGHQTSENDGIDFYKTDKKTHECEFCDFVSTTKGGLSAHKTRFHKEEAQNSKAFLCEVCNRRYTSDKTLKMHIKRDHQV